MLEEHGSAIKARRRAIEPSRSSPLCIKNLGETADRAKAKAPEPCEPGSAPQRAVEKPPSNREAWGAASNRTFARRTVPVGLARAQSCWHTTRRRLPLSYRQYDRLAVRLMRRPSKTELEFLIVAACMALPAGYWIVRTVIALL